MQNSLAAETYNRLIRKFWLRCPIKHTVCSTCQVIDSFAGSDTHVQANVKNSYILSVPDEVLLEIFRIGNALEKSDGLFDFAPKIPLLIRLSRLCSGLRRLVLNAPLLWTIFDRKVLSSSSILNMFLKRSWDCGLEIHINGTIRREKFGKLVNHVNRWQALNILAEVGNDTRLFYKILAPFRNLYVPRLIHLDIAYVSYVEDAPVKTIFTGGTPALKSLDLCTALCFPNTSAVLRHSSFIFFQETHH